jgi:hypothetical protein
VIIIRLRISKPLAFDIITNHNSIVMLTVYASNLVVTLICDQITLPLNPINCTEPTYVAISHPVYAAIGRALNGVGTSMS